ncbi:hypothetical protein FEM48_Zijuj01G0104300 [Ziziphus jujuba var. spinosa]|uniref:EGF-like domain-containing protein n=1 Tax=Ziziphus jujuba var. spinosa TaxID=714518 RepID=A0A978W0Q4_ZIZJJ|nr:hypothetical protein FEM48_Zijuj01G0104300 [Ziziphus jujuba var. spinosa]
MASIIMAIGLLMIVLATATTIVAAQSIRHCRESCGDLKVPYPFGMDKDCYLGENFPENKFPWQIGILKQVPSMAIGILIVLVVLATTTTVVAAQSAAHCRESCGDLKVPYPFGMDEGCYLGEKFFITCNESYHPHRAFLTTGNVEVTNISLDDGELSVSQFIGRDCYDQNGVQTNNWQPSLNLSLYTVSSTKNKFFAVGCDTEAFVQGYRGTEVFATGCISWCESISTFNESCSGVGCCQTSIPYRMKNITVSVNSYYNHTDIWKYNPCSCAFVVDEKKFNFSRTSFKDLRKVKELPVVINWAVEDESGKTCSDAEKSSDFACKNNTKCIDVKDGSGGYHCQCLTGYHGNPYHRDGCQDIDECKIFSNPCNPGKCHNLPGNWTCTCPKGSKIINGTGCSKKDAIDQSERVLILYIALANELEGLVNLDKHPWGKVDLCGEENEYLLGSTSNTYENSSGKSGFRSSGTAIVGHDSSLEVGFVTSEKRHITCTKVL